MLNLCKSLLLSLPLEFLLFIKLSFVTLLSSVGGDLFLLFDLYLSLLLVLSALFNYWPIGINQ
jgi:hypothetical protein